MVAVPRLPWPTQEAANITAKKVIHMSEPTLTRAGLLDCQVCVPASWSDDQVTEFAQKVNPCGTTHGWQVRKQGNKLLAGADERVQCAQRSDCVHIMLDA